MKKPTDNTALDESWQRFPEARIRMRENGLKTILDGLGEDGFCTASPPRFHFVEEGVYIDILLNVGKHGSIVALPLEIMIPAKMPVVSKKKPLKEKKVDEAIQPEPVVAATPELPVIAEAETGSTGGSDS